MRVLMVGKSPSIALDDLRRYWGEVIFARPPWLKPGRYDLVIAQEPTIRSGLPAYLIAKQAGAPFFCEVHANYLEHMTVTQRMLAYWLLRRASLVRAVNGTIERQLRRMGFRNVLRIPAIYIKPELFKRLKPQRERGPLVLFVGRLTRQKGLNLLLESFRLVAEKMPEATLYLVGRGEMKEWVRGRLSALGLEKRTQILDWVPLRELVKLYNEAAVLVCTSLYEGGPRVVFEAAACGTPSVSTRVGIVPEVFRDGVEVLFVERRAEDVAAAVVDLLKDADLRERIGEAARTRTLSLFSWDEAVRRYAMAYLEALEDLRGPLRRA
jgi:glycosyltransferase involved in cell wall biosynthesis